MKHIDSVINMIDYIENSILKTIELAIQMVPDSEIDFTPRQGLNTLKYLFYHVVNSPFIYLSGIGNELVSVEDFNKISFPLESVTTFKELQKYYDTFSDFLSQLKTSIKANFLSQEIKYNLKSVDWGEWVLTGQRAIETAFEEMIHHRGQIYIYLRLLNIKPPLIYPYL